MKQWWTVLMILFLICICGCEGAQTDFDHIGEPVTSVPQTVKPVVTTTVVEETSVITTKEKTAETSVETILETTEPVKDPDDELFFLKPSASCESFRVDIYKEDRRLELFADDTLTGRFVIALGFNPVGRKEKEGDGKTPEGSYYICYINRNSPFYIFYGLSYPGIEDAKKAYENNRITENQLKNIEQAIQRGETPNWYTPLGGEVGIHGGGILRDWTAGCIALTDEDIDLLDPYLLIGTKVNIYP